MLGRAGISAVLIDPHAVYPFDLRVEKLSGDEQVERFARTRLAESVLRFGNPRDGENWIAGFGYLLDKKPSRQYGIMYDALINAIRSEIPSGVTTRPPGGTGQRVERRPASGRRLVGGRCV